MKKSLLYILCSVALGTSFTACDNWVGDTEPTDFLTSEQVWNDNTLIEGVLAELYNDVATNGNMDNDVNHSLFDDFMWCGLMNQDVESARNQMVAYSYDEFRYYDYAYIYKCNQAIESLATVSQLADDTKALYTAEFRFLRAYAYFQMCIRMGGVPLVTETQSYTPGMDVTELQKPRESEANIYKFVYEECMDIEAALKGNNGVTNKSRANQWAALALASRSMLYAGSIAKYNITAVRSVEQPGVVGMEGEDPTDYYTKSLAASERIISEFANNTLQGIDNPSSDNFYNAICSKDNNTEVLWTKDYNASKFHTFSFANIAQSMNEDNDNGSDLCPTLQLVETYGALQDKNPDGSYRVYTTRGEIFNPIQDVRLKGTCLVPDQEFKGATLDVQAGVAVYDPSVEKGYALIEGSDPKSTFTGEYTVNNKKYTGDGGTLVGNDGPLNRATYTNTGFNLHKFVDETAGSSARGQGSYIWYVYFRMGEIYLNAAEAAMELGQTSKALTYVNKVRQRAGLGANSWSASDLTIDNMLNERRRELALEDHRLWDMKRLRKAHGVWNGVESENTMLYALYPYRIVGGPDNNKFIYVRKVAPRFLAPRNFRVGNYYTAFEQDVLDKNPKLVQNPNM